MTAAVQNKPRWATTNDRHRLRIPEGMVYKMDHEAGRMKCWVADEILEMRVDKNEHEYLVSFVGSPRAEASWHTEAEMLSCRLLLEIFHEKASANVVSTVDTMQAGSNDSAAAQAAQTVTTAAATTATASCNLVNGSSDERPSITPAPLPTDAASRRGSHTDDRAGASMTGAELPGRNRSALTAADTPSLPRPDLSSPPAPAPAPPSTIQQADAAPLAAAPAASRAVSGGAVQAPAAGGRYTGGAVQAPAAGGRHTAPAPSIRAGNADPLDSRARSFVTRVSTAFEAARKRKAEILIEVQREVARSESSRVDASLYTTEERLAQATAAEEAAMAQQERAARVQAKLDVYLRAKELTKRSRLAEDAAAEEEKSAQLAAKREASLAGKAREQAESDAADLLRALQGAEGHR